MTSCDVSSDVHSTFAGSIAEKKRCMKQIRYQKNTFNNWVNLCGVYYLLC